VPALERGLPAAPGSHSWPRLILTPGAHPISELASRLAGPAGEEPDRLRSRLAADPAALAPLARAVLQRHARGNDTSGRRLVLIVDQFEEVFTACQDSRERQAFLDALCSAAGSVPDRETAAVVVLGLRADFYARCMADHRLAQALQDAQLVVTPLTADQLRAAIEGPAERAGLHLEPGLSQLLIRDLGADTGDPPAAVPVAAGRLPLLAHALLATWQQRDGAVLTLAGYQATGGIREAVGRTAEATYATLNADEQHAARLLLLRMVRVGGIGSEDTRRPLRLTEFAEPPDTTEDPPPDAGPLAPRTVARVLNALTAARLVTLGTETAEITHDVLLHAWPRLRQWINADRADLLTEQQLVEAAEAWEAEGHDTGALYRGTRLETAREWARQRLAPLSAAVAAFLAASNAAARRRTRLARATIAVLSLLLVLSVAATTLAVQQRNDAVRRGALLASRNIAREADTVRGENTALAMQLALAAYRSAPTPEARSSLLASASTSFDTPIAGHTKAVNEIAYSADGHTLATASADHTVHLVDVTHPDAATRAATLQVDAPATLAFSPAGPLLALGVHGQVRLLDTTDPYHPRTLSTFTSRVSEEASIAIDRDGRLLAIGGSNGELELWNVADPGRPTAEFATVLGEPRIVALAFSPDQPELATAGRDGRIRLWDVTHPRLPAIDATLLLTSWDGKKQRAPTSVSFSRRRHLLAATGAQDSTGLWNVSNPRRPKPQDRPYGDEKITNLSTQFSPDGQHIAIGTDQGQVSLCELPTYFSSSKVSWGVCSRLLGRSAVVSVAYSPDGTVLATGTEDGIVHQWRSPLPTLPSAGLLASQGAPFSPDGHLLATYDARRTLRVWEVTDPHHPRLAATVPIPTADGGFVGDGQMLASLDDDLLRVRLWDVSNPRRPAPLTTFTNPTAPDTRKLELRLKYFDIAIDAERHLLALAHQAAEVIQLWDFHEQRHPRLLSTLKGYAYGVSFIPATRSLVVGRVAGFIQLVDTADPRHPVLGAVRPNGKARFRAFAVARSTRLIATLEENSTSGGNGRLQLWSVTAANRAVRTWSLPESSNNFSISDDDHLLAVATGRTIHLLDITDPHNPSTRATLTTAADVDRVEFLAGGRRLAALSAEGTDDQNGTERKAMTMWDVASPDTPTILLTAPIIPADLTGLLPSSPDGTLVVVQRPDAGDNSLGLLDLDSDRLAGHLCSLNGPKISREQWQQHVPDLPYDPPCN
jgi:WD40 repeat protein